MFDGNFTEEINEIEAVETTQETDTGIVFDFNRLNHRIVTTTSLTDLYGFPVFSERFTAQVNQFNRNRSDELEESFLRVFQGEPTADLQSYFQAVMHAEPEIIIQADWEAPPPLESPVLMILFIGAGMFVAAFVWLAVEKIRKKRRKS